MPQAGRCWLGRGRFALAVLAGAAAVAGALVSHRSAVLVSEERDRAERALDQARRASMAKGEFLSRMSHEIRTPLNGIMGMTAIALANLESPQKVRSCLQKIDLSSAHLLSLINDILDMSKIESGKVEVRHEPFYTGAFLGAAASVFAEQAKERGIRFCAHVAPEVEPCLMGDALKLNQVLYNLVGNALKFTPEGGSVRLLVSPVPERAEPNKNEVLRKVCLRFTVADTGVGIAPDKLGKIFDPFEQAVRTDGRQSSGTGLGLSITRHFVELMGGTIGVESEPGQGSTFTVELPFAVCEGAAAAAFERSQHTDRQRAVRLSGAHVLVAEDMPLNLEIALELMEMAGAQADAARNGREAVERFAASPVGYYNVVLMDVQMPELDGYQATEAIRALPRADARSVIILAMTANAFAEDERESLARGMDGHLSKPLDIRDVYDKIDGFLEH